MRGWTASLLIAASIILSVQLVFAEAVDWRQAPVGKWSGIPDGVGDRVSRVLIITKIHEDGRIEGTFGGLVAVDLTIDPESRATLKKDGRYVSLKIKTQGFVVSLDLDYDLKRDTLSGDYYPRPYWKAYTYFTREKL